MHSATPKHRPQTYLSYAIQSDQHSKTYIQLPTVYIFIAALTRQARRPGRSALPTPVLSPLTSHRPTYSLASRPLPHPVTAAHSIPLTFHGPIPLTAWHHGHFLTRSQQLTQYRSPFTAPPYLTAWHHGHSDLSCHSCSPGHRVQPTNPRRAQTTRQ